MQGEGGFDQSLVIILCKSSNYVFGCCFIFLKSINSSFKVN